MATPYITPDILINAPTGISWETIPDFESTQTEQYAEQMRICWRTTHWIDRQCNQILRATIDTEEVRGPDFYLTVDSNGVARCLLSRFPIAEIVSAQYAPATQIPPQWQSIPTNAMYIENASYTPAGAVATVGASGPFAVNIAPGYVSWLTGRNSVRLQTTFINGYAHAGLIGSVAVGATTLAIDDCTGMVGATLYIYDGASTEFVSVTAASTTAGPGAITLAAPTAFAHTASPQQPLIVSSMPSDIQEAAIFYATYATLTRGATATTVQNVGGGQSGSGSGHQMLSDAKEILEAYRRTR